MINGELRMLTHFYMLILHLPKTQPCPKYRILPFEVRQFIEIDAINSCRGVCYAAFFVLYFQVFQLPKSQISSENSLFQTKFYFFSNFYQKKNKKKTTHLKFTKQMCGGNSRVLTYDFSKNVTFSRNSLVFRTRLFQSNVTSFIK